MYIFGVQFGGPFIKTMGHIPTERYEHNCWVAVLRLTYHNMGISYIEGFLIGNP